MKKRISFNKFLTADYLFSLVIFASIILFIIKLTSGGFTLALLNFIIDLFLLLVFYLIFRWNKYLRGIFLIAFFISFIFFLGPSIFLEEFALMKYSFSNLSLGMMGYFFDSILTVGNYLLVACAIVFVFILGFIRLSQRYFYRIFIGCGILFLVIVIFGYSFVANSYITTIADLTESKESIDIALGDFNESFFRKGVDYSFEPEHGRVLVFVMEQTNYNDFMAEVDKIPYEDNFFLQTKGFSHWYSNYYTQNQDSRTAVWDMLNAEFIPYECYLSDWDKYYGTVMNDNNLVDFFKMKGFESVVAISMYDVGLLAGAYNWSDVIFLKEFKGGVDPICLHEIEFEKGCEDMAIIDDVKEEILENENLFLLQEFIFGHGENYMKLSGKSRTRYYNDYLMEIWNFLEENDIDATLLILSDHGDKGYFSKDKEHYHIPFVVVDRNREYKLIDDLYTHLSFSNILFSYIGGDFPDPEGETYVIGQTLGGEIGYITKQGYFMGDLDSKFFKNFVLNFTNKQIAEKVGILLGYQESIKEESINENNHCIYCNYNIERAKSKRL